MRPDRSPASRMVPVVVALALAVTPVVAPRPAAAATAAADYRFQDSLTSSVGSAGALTSVGPGANAFTSDIMDGGASRRVLSFPQGNGLSVPTSGVIPNDTWTIAMLVRLEETTGWVRLVDFRQGLSEDGLYQVGRKLSFFGGVTATGDSFRTHVYSQVVLTRDAGGTISGYVDGVQQITFTDSSSDGVIQNDEIRLFRDNGTEHAAGAIARLRLYGSALSGAEVAALDDTPAPCEGNATAACDTEGSTLVADYRFEDALTSGVAGAPALTPIGPGSNAFVTDVIRRSRRRVLSFPAGNGVQLASTRGLVASNAYSVAMLVRLEETNGWVRLIDLRNGVSEDGAYQVGRNLAFYGGVTAASATLEQHVYEQIVLTRDRNDNVTMYSDGVQVLTFRDTTGKAVIDETFTMRFFRDNGAEHAAGAIARLRVYNGTLSASAVASLSETPAPCKGDPNAICDTDGASLVADYRFEGTRSSSTGEPPDVSDIGPGTNRFDGVRVNGKDAAALRFPEGNGVSLGSTRGLVGNESYSVAMLFSIDDASGWKRLIDLRGRTSEDGLYATGGRLAFYGGVTASSATIAAGDFVQVVMTRDRNQNLTVYSDGAQVLTFKDTAGKAVIDESFTLDLFRDNGVEHSAGSLVRLRLYDGPLSASAVAALDGAGPPINVIKGTAGNDTLTGTAGRDLILGGGGNDTIDGGGGFDVLRGEGGKDVLRGGSGDDRLDGGPGDDDLDGGKGTDTADYSEAFAGTNASGAAARVGVVVNLGDGQGKGYGIDRLFRIENLIGSSGSDVLIGDAGVNGIDGRAGHDAIQGSGAADELTGGPGADTIKGLGGNDLLRGGDGADILVGGPGADRLFGGSGADDLTGGGGEDLLDGGDGDDELIADDGARDRVYGGKGTDRARVDRGVDQTRSIERFL